jgi:hypothetical protein
MKKLYSILIIMTVSALASMQVSAKVITFEELRAMADKGKPEVVDVMYSNRVPLGRPHVRLVTYIEDKLYLDGVVVGTPHYPRHANLEMVYNTSSYEVYAPFSMAACYLQSPDGKYGVKLMFKNEANAKTLQPFSTSEISLKGLTLVKEGNCYVLEGCLSEHVIYSEPGVLADLPKKEKYINELTDDDIYTYVTIKDCEYVFKNGAFTNVIEQALTRSMAGRNQGAGRADVGNRIIMDANGDLINTLVNTKTTNRRIGGGVPQGTGMLRGILVDTYNPRYGDNGCYSIRPHCDEDFLMDWMGTPGYKTIAAWDWNVNRNPGFIPAEYGAGFMTCDCPGLKVNRVDDWDNPFIDIPSDKKADSRGLRGAVTHGAMQLAVRTCDWWDWDNDCGRSLMLVCSTQAASGKDMFLAFTSAGGNRSTDTSFGYPSFWKVQWSVDGVNFTDVDAKDINMKNLWHDWWGPARQIVDKENYELSYESAIGFVENLVHLPAHLLGQKRVYLKITPSRKVVSSVGYMHKDNVTLRPQMTDMCYVNFGEIIIGYR